MQFKNVKEILKPLIRGGHEWQFISLNGKENKPKYYFSDIQWFIVIISILSLIKLQNGISKEMIGYVMSAFAISVSLFMSLLISIFDKFENTDLSIKGKSEDDIHRLVQKKNFFKRFISITSYLVILSIFIILLCSLNYIFNLEIGINFYQFTFDLKEIDFLLTFKSGIILLYRGVLNYFLLSYLLMTLFIASSAYEYYISEIDKRKIL